MMKKVVLDKKMSLKEFASYLIKEEGVDEVQFAIASRRKKSILCNVMGTGWWVAISPLAHRVIDVWKAEV